MGGFFMLFFLLLVRLLPVTLLGMCKSQKRIKMMYLLLMLLNVSGVLIASASVVIQEHVRSFLYIPCAMFPHYICYVFSVCILARCIWHAWSQRVWKRIHLLSQAAILFGIFLELCWNPKILQILLKILK